MGRAPQMRGPARRRVRGGVTRCGRPPPRFRGRGRRERSPSRGLEESRCFANRSAKRSSRESQRISSSSRIRKIFFGKVTEGKTQVLVADCRRPCYSRSSVLCSLPVNVEKVSRTLWRPIKSTVLVRSRRDTGPFEESSRDRRRTSRPITACLTRHRRSELYDTCHPSLRRPGVAPSSPTPYHRLALRIPRNRTRAYRKPGVPIFRG